MTNTLSCVIPTSPITYEIEIGSLDYLPSFISSFGNKFAIVTDTQVAALYGEKLCASLLKTGLQIHLFSFPSGEIHKNRKTKEELEDLLFYHSFGKDSCIIALGGGVVTDLAGYLAATYCRGLPLILIPTTLLGMVDASIGGKTAVNTSFGKNMLGCFYLPKKVFIEPTFLQTLPLNELKNGIVEMIKHGLIADLSHYEYLEQRVDLFLHNDMPTLKKGILDSCQIKKEIVEQDLQDAGKRQLLNFGHTIGHALEKLTDYTMPHGEAVAIGILAESYLSYRLGYLSSKSFQRIDSLLRHYDLPLKLLFPLSFESLLQAMRMDKKSQKGEPKFVLLQEIGSPLLKNHSFCHSVDPIILKHTLHWINDALCLN